MLPKHKFMLIVSVIVLFALACSLTPQQPAQQSNPDAVSSQVAQTMVAKGAVETQVAETVAAQGAAQGGTQGGGDSQAGQNQEPSSQSPAATTQAPPTATPTATEEYKPVIGVKALNLGGPDELFEFEIDELMFEYTNANDKAGFEDGKFVFSIEDPIGFDIWTYSWKEDKNYYVEVTVEMPEQCSGKDRGGFIFRTPQNIYDAGYIFEISCDGHFRLTNWDGAVHNDIAIWQGNNTINSGGGAKNRIGVFVDGSFIRLFVNAVEVGAYNDQTYLGIGKIGLVIGVENTKNFKIRFDDFAYWDLP